MLLLGFLAACSSQRIGTTPGKKYPVQEIIRLRRQEPTQPPIVTGHIDAFQDNKIFEANYVSVCIDDECQTAKGSTAVTDANGKYTRILTPGKHSILATFVGLIPSKVSSLRVAQGDSIRINFHLRVDPTPLE